MRAGQKGDVEPELPDGRNVLGRVPIQNLELHALMLLMKRLQQLLQEPRRKRGKDANAKMAVLHTANRIHDLGTFAEVANDLARALEESPASDGEMHTAAVTVEEGRAEAVFKIANAATDGGLLHPYNIRSLAEAAMLRSGYKIAQMTNFNAEIVRHHLL